MALLRRQKGMGETRAPRRHSFVCVKCGYDTVRPSRVRWYDLPLMPLARPYRCDKCYRRSYKVPWKKR